MRLTRWHARHRSRERNNWRLHRRTERRSVLEDRLLKLAQLGTWLKSDLIQRRSRVPIRGQRLGMTPCPIQAEHQKPPGPLPQRVGSDQRGDLPNDVRVLAQ